MEYSTADIEVKAADTGEVDNAGGFIVDIGSLYDFLNNLQDSRDPRGMRYQFVILAKLSGEDRLTGIAEWVSHRKEALANALGLDRPQAPHRTTYSRILGKTLSVESLEDALREFFTADRTDRQLVQIAIDGKSLRGSIAAGRKRGVRLLAAYLPNEGVVLAQVEVDGKRNEITAAPSLLKAIDLRHKVVSADAMLAQRGLSDQVVKSGGEYIWTVKGNQPSLREDIATLFEGAESCEDERRAESVNKGHGRIEKRGIRASSMLNDYLDWPHVQQVFEIKRHIRYIRDGKTTDETAYGITSLSSDQVSARDFWKWFAITGASKMVCITDATRHCARTGAI